MDKIGRNDPCPCGSGKKYKKCCLEKDEREKSEQLKQARAQEEAADAAEQEKEKEEHLALPARKQKGPSQPGFRGYQAPKIGTGFVDRSRRVSNRTGE